MFCIVLWPVFLGLKLDCIIIKIFTRMDLHSFFCTLGLCVVQHVSAVFESEEVRGVKGFRGLREGIRLRRVKILV